MYSFFQNWDNVDEGLPGTCNNVTYLRNQVTNKLALSTATTTATTNNATTTTTASTQGSTTTQMFRTGQLETKTTISSPISDIQTVTPRTDLLMQIQTLQHGQTMYIGFLVGFGLFIVLAIVLIVYRIKNPGNVTHPPHILCISHTFFIHALVLKCASLIVDVGAIFGFKAHLYKLVSSKRGLTLILKGFDASVLKIFFLLKMCLWLAPKLTHSTIGILNMFRFIALTVSSSSSSRNIYSL